MIQLNTHGVANNYGEGGYEDLTKLYSNFLMSTLISFEAVCAYLVDMFHY